MQQQENHPLHHPPSQSAEVLTLRPSSQNHLSPSPHPFPGPTTSVSMQSMYPTASSRQSSTSATGLVNNSSSNTNGPIERKRSCTEIAASSPPPLAHRGANNNNNSEPPSPNTHASTVSSQGAPSLGPSLPASNNALVTCPFRRFVRQGRIGKGAVKEVYRAMDEELGIEVAWNEIEFSHCLHAKANILREIELLQGMDHPHVLRCFTSWEDVDRQCIVFISELMTSGTLAEFVGAQSQHHLKEAAVGRYGRQILEGIAYLHQKNIIHRDLKCSNVFINGSKGEVKVGDLGVSISSRSATSVIGTPEYMAPEMFREHYTNAIDVWSFGLCILEMLTGRRPYSECDNIAQIYRKLSSKVLPLMDGIPSAEQCELVDAMLQCLRFEPEDRPTAEQLLQHAAFRDAEPNALESPDHSATVTEPNDSILGPPPLLSVGEKLSLMEWLRSAPRVVRPDVLHFALTRQWIDPRDADHLSMSMPRTAAPLCAHCGHPQGGDGLEDTRSPSASVSLHPSQPNAMHGSYFGAANLSRPVSRAGSMTSQHPATSSTTAAGAGHGFPSLFDTDIAEVPFHIRSSTTSPTRGGSPTVAGTDTVDTFSLLHHAASMPNMRTLYEYHMDPSSLIGNGGGASLLVAAHSQQQQFTPNGTAHNGGGGFPPFPQTALRHTMSTQHLPAMTTNGVGGGGASKLLSSQPLDRSHLPPLAPSAAFPTNSSEVAAADGGVSAQQGGSEIGSGEARKRKAAESEQKILAQLSLLLPSAGNSSSLTSPSSLSGQTPSSPRRHADVNAGTATSGGGGEGSSGFSSQTVSMES